MRFSAWCAGAALLVLASVGHAGAPEYRLLRLGGDLVKWGEPRLSAGASITYAVAERDGQFPEARNCRSIRPLRVVARSSGIAMRSIEQELRAAFAAWEEAIQVRFRRIDDQSAADIVIGAQGAPRGRAFANVLPAHKGVTERAADGAPRLAAFTDRPRPDTAPSNLVTIAPIKRSLVCLNPEERWKVGFDGDLDVYDLRYTFMHEIGHALGLDHPSASGELMSFSYEEKFRTPQKGDVMGAALLYGIRPAL